MSFRKALSSQNQQPSAESNHASRMWTPTGLITDLRWRLLAELPKLRNSPFELLLRTCFAGKQQQPGLRAGGLNIRRKHNAVRIPGILLPRSADQAVDFERPFSAAPRHSDWTAHLSASEKNFSIQSWGHVRRDFAWPHSQTRSRLLLAARRRGPHSQWQHKQAGCHEPLR